MSKYTCEPWPPSPKSGMVTNSVPAGVKVTDTETGHFHCCNIYTSQYKNREAAIATLKAMDSDAHEQSREA